jgi:hypothetical protein
MKWIPEIKSDSMEEIAIFFGISATGGNFKP